MSLGFWNSLTELNKTTQTHLVPGVIDEDINKGSHVLQIPVVQAKGQSITWNKKTQGLTTQRFAPGDPLAIGAGVKYTQVSSTLKQFYTFPALDNFIVATYGTINDYEAMELAEAKKSVLNMIMDAAVYDDELYGGSTFMNGLHELAARNTGTDLDIDNGDTLGLALWNMRKCKSAMKFGIDYWLFPTCIFNRLAAAMTEAGLVTLASGTAGALSGIVRNADDFGKPVYSFDGVPIVEDTWLVGEVMNQGNGSQARTKETVTANMRYSVFGIKKGNVINLEPGLCLAFGDTEMMGQFYKLTYFDKLETRDGKAIRLVSYCNQLLGSLLALGRIFDIKDLAIIGG